MCVCIIIILYWNYVKGKENFWGVCYLLKYENEFLYILIIVKMFVSFYFVYLF